MGPRSFNQASLAGQMANAKGEYQEKSQRMKLDLLQKSNIQILIIIFTGLLIYSNTRWIFGLVYVGSAFFKLFVSDVLIF